MSKPNVGGLPQSGMEKPEDIRIAVLKNEYADLNQPDDLIEVGKRWNVRINLFPIEAPELAQLPAQQPDIVIFGYAGGFLDPEGFLTVITASLKADLPTIFGASYSMYQKASSDQDWNERRSLYEELNRELVTHQVVAPGWRPNIYSFTRNTLARSESSLSYTPKLKEFQSTAGKKEGKP